MPSAHDPHRHHRRGVRDHRPDALLGSVGYENKTNERGERLIWLEPTVVNRLRAMRGAGESYSDVILKLAGEAG